MMINIKPYLWSAVKMKQLHHVLVWENDLMKIIFTYIIFIDYSAEIGLC